MPEHTPAPTPHRAVYGYAFYLLSIFIFIMYVLWAVVLPIAEWDLPYLPDKYFAIVLPMLVVVGVSLFVFFIYPAINMSLTPNVDEIASVIDVDLALKGTRRKTANSWKELTETMKQPRVNETCDFLSVQDCAFCSGSHNLPKPSEQVSSLHFLDLNEVTKQLFDYTDK